MLPRNQPNSSLSTYHMFIDWGFLHAQTLVNKPEGELSICKWVGCSRGHTITEEITRGLLFWFCYNSLPECRQVSDSSWVHSVFLLRTWKAVTGRHHHIPCPRKTCEYPELLPEPVPGRSGRCNTTQGSQGIANAAPVWEPFQTWQHASGWSYLDSLEPKA